MLIGYFIFEGIEAEDVFEGVASIVDLMFPGTVTCGMQYCVREGRCPNIGWATAPNGVHIPCEAAGVLILPTSSIEMKNISPNGGVDVCGTASPNSVRSLR